VSFLVLTELSPVTRKVDVNGSSNSAWLDNPNIEILDVFDRVVDNLISFQKIPKHAYSIMIEKCIPEKRISVWNELVDDPQDLDWEEIHLRNFKCTIDSRLRSFYFKIFHNAIAFNDFLYKIKRRDSPLCTFCEKMPETITHVFCDCDVVQPIWKDMLTIIRNKHDINFLISDFDKMFGVPGDQFLTYLFLCVKYHVFVCKFQSKKTNVISVKAYIKNNREVEYLIAKKKGKLSSHFRKWRFDL
jgi:hypothetical protein